MCPTPLPSSRPSLHQACPPLQQAHAAPPRRNDQRRTPPPSPAPLPLRHRTRTHTPCPHTRDATRHGHRAHSCCIDDSKLSSIGIVPDRGLSWRYLMETWVAEGKTSAGAGAGGQTVAQSRDDGRRAAIPRAPPHCLPCPLALLPLHTLAPPRFHRRIMCRHSLLPRPQIPHPPPSSLHLCTPHHAPPHSCPQHPRRATRHRQSAHKYPIDASEPISVGIVPDRWLLLRYLMETWVAEGETSTGIGTGGQTIGSASRDDGRRAAIPRAPPHYPRSSPHQVCTPLHQAHVATPRWDGYRLLPLHLPLPLHHRTRTRTPAHTGDATRHRQSAHNCCVDDSKLISVGIVPDRELVSRSLMEV